MRNSFELYMIVSDPEIAKFVSDNGVARLFVDLEHMGKNDRQKGDTWKSNHTISDVSSIRAAAPNAHLMVRVNPIFKGSKREVDCVIERGADSIMLPMFHTYEELAKFMDIVDGRVEVVPLVETVKALKAVPEILERIALKRLHIGLNDLHLDMGLKFMFEPIANGSLETACAALRKANLPFGIGGIARVGEGSLQPELLLGEHVRLGSSSAILSRTFHRGAQSLPTLKNEIKFATEIKKINSLYMQILQWDQADLTLNRGTVRKRVQEISEQIEK